MDGASKFVKGDAIAGIIIMLINIIGGLVIGVMQLGMPWAEALRTFTLLTIGDGIVTQVPALVIAVGTGIIVTRSSADSNLSAEVFRQVTAFPKTLLIVVAALTGVLLLPGIPAWPALLLIGLFLSVAYATRTRGNPAQDAQTEEDAAQATQSEDVYEALSVEPVEVKLGVTLVPLVNDGAGVFMERINGFRKQYAQESGFVVPKVRFKDDRALADDAYEIRVFGSTVAAGEVKPGQMLAIHTGGEPKKLPGIETRDPSYGLPAYWIQPEDRDLARSARFTLVDPETVLLTHLNEVLRQQSAALLSRAETSTLIDRVRQRQAGLVDELIPSVLTLSEVQKVLQNLLREKVSIRNLELILEVLVDSGRSVKDAQQLTELARQRLAPSICQPLIGDSGYMHVLTFDPTVEQSLAKSLRAANGAATLALEPRFAEQLLSGAMAQVERMMKSSMVPVLLCAPELRRHVRTLTERLMPHLRVLAITEVPNNVNLKAFGSIGTGLAPGS